MDEDVKAYKTYAAQVEILADRGMDMGDRASAAAMLRRVDYYRLSGYCYPFRKLTSSGRLDDFYAGTRFADVIALYEFDARLRTATFAAMTPVELAIRALLGHELGRIDPCASRAVEAGSDRAQGRPVCEVAQAIRTRAE